MKRELLVSLLTVVVAGSLVCGVCAKEANRIPTGEFRMAVSTCETEALGPVMGTTDTKWYQTLLYDSLVGVDPPSTGLSTKTGVAYRWEHSPDYKVWTFYLRKGIKFHNGDDLTAEDVKYTLDRAMGPVGVSPNKAMLRKTIDSIEVIDKYTVRIHCKEPNSMISLYMSEHIGQEAMIVPKKYIEEKGNDYFRAHPIGAGVYKFKEHVPGSYMLFEAVDRHWALGVPRYKYVRISIVKEFMTRLGLLERGEVDMISLPRDRVKEVKRRGFPIVEDPAQATNLLIICDTWVKDYPVSDIRVREALNIAIDRKAVHETLYGGLGKLAPYGSATDVSIGYKPADPPYRYDPERARALMKEAGYGPGKPCPINVYSFPLTTFPEAEQFIEAAISYWEDVGFDVNIIKVPEYGLFRKKWGKRTTYGALGPIVVGGRVWSIPVTRVITQSEGKLATCKIPELDKALDEALAAIDPDKRAALAHKVFRIMYDNYVHVPVAMGPGCFAVNPKTIPDWQDWHMGVTMFDHNLEWVLFR